jgi:hypothetical protein
MSGMNIWAGSSAAWPKSNLQSALITVLTPHQRSHGMPTRVQMKQNVTQDFAPNVAQPPCPWAS